MIIQDVVKFCGTIPGWMNKEELCWLYLTAKSYDKPIKWVEVGSWQGRSIFAVAMGAPHGSTITCVDSFSGNEGSISQEELKTGNQVKAELQATLTKIQELRPDLIVGLFESDSIEASDHFEDGSLTGVFLDADHSYNGVVADIKAWERKVGPEGVFCGHDYIGDWVEVRKAVDELLPDIDRATLLGNFAGGIWTTNNREVHFNENVLL